MKIGNAFSANMLEPGFGRCSVQFAEISLAEAKESLASGVDSAVGHADTAAIFSTELGVSVPPNRATVSLKSGDALLLGQYTGPRLPEGTTTLPDGARIRWIRVTVA